MEFLYRYRPAKDYELETISRKQVCFACVDLLNDDQEFKKFLFLKIGNELLYGELGKITGTPAEEYSAFFDQITDEQKRTVEDAWIGKFRIACFTKTYENAHMWECYAAKTGFCIAYRKEDLIQRPILCSEIGYTDKSIIIDDCDRFKLESILYTKNSRFNQEEEIRAITSADCEKITVQDYFEKIDENECKDKEWRYFLQIPKIGEPPHHYKAQKKTFLEIKPSAIIVSQNTDSECANRLKEIARQLNCEYREIKI